MAKLFEAIDAPPTSLTPAQLAAGQYVQVAKDIREQIRAGIGVMATLANQLGTTAIFAQMSPDVAAGFATCLPILAQLWVAAAPDGVPMPSLPADPPVSE